MDMKRVSEMAQRVHPALVEQLFSESTLAEIARWEEIEERLRIEESEDDFAPAREGCVYFSDTPSMHGSIMKIGGTKYDGTTRAKQLFQAGVLEPYTCRLEKRFDDWKLYERAIQEYFKSSRVYSNKEFFFVTQEQAQKLFDQLDGTVPLQAEDQSKWEQALSTTKAKIEKYRHMWHLKQLKGRDILEHKQTHPETAAAEDRVSTLVCIDMYYLITLYIRRIFKPSILSLPRGLKHPTTSLTLTYARKSSISKQ